MVEKLFIPVTLRALLKQVAPLQVRILLAARKLPYLRNVAASTKQKT